MPPTELDGFERLDAVLLSAVTSDVFNIARSGDQPADALSAAVDIAIQGKGSSAVKILTFEVAGHEDTNVRRALRRRRLTRVRLARWPTDWKLCWRVQ